MNEVSLAVALSLWIATLLILVIWVAFWKTKKKKTVHSDSEEEFLSEEISQNDDEPAFGTKLSSIQPIYKPYPIVYEVSVNLHIILHAAALYFSLQLVCL